MATFQLFFQSGRAKDLSSPLYFIQVPWSRHHPFSYSLHLWTLVFYEGDRKDSQVSDTRRTKYYNQQFNVPRLYVLWGCRYVYWYNGAFWRKTVMFDWSCSNVDEYRKPGVHNIHLPKQQMWVALRRHFIWLFYDTELTNMIMSWR